MIVQAGVIHHKPRIAILGTITQQSAVPRGDENHHRWTKGKKKNRDPQEAGEKELRVVAVDSKQAKLRYGYETSKVHKEQKNPRLLISHEPQRERERERKNLIQLVEGGEGGGGVHRLGLAEHLLQHDADAATNYSSKEKG
jgi:hypothetical protein